MSEALACATSGPYRYPVDTVYWDYLRAAGGVVLCLLPIGTLELAAPISALLGLLAAGFLVYAWQARRRQLTEFGLDDDNLRCGGRARKDEIAFPWRTLRRMRLAYFSVRRDGRRGWMELKLDFDVQTVRLDSRLDGFAALVWAASAAAARQSLELDPATVSNLESLGVEHPTVDSDSASTGPIEHV